MEEVTSRFVERYAALSESMVGFTGLIYSIQWLLVSESLVTGEIWVCGNVDLTRGIAKRTLKELVEQCEAWGIEQ